MKECDTCSTIASLIYNTYLAQHYGWTLPKWDGKHCYVYVRDIEGANSATSQKLGRRSLCDLQNSLIPTA